MKKLLFILPLLYYSCTSEKVDTDEASKSDKMFKLLKNIAKDELGISKLDCSQRCQDSFEYLDWNSQTIGKHFPGEEIDSLFNQCVKECNASSVDSLEAKTTNPQ